MQRLKLTAENVINSGYFHLMEDRFGEKAKANGDVFSDLFVENNQNRTSGNMESIWVMQFEYTLLVAVQIPMTGHAVPGNPNTSRLPVLFWQTHWVAAACRNWYQ